MISEAEGRKCNHCGKVKPFSELVADTMSKGGYRPLCKPCKNKQQSKQRIAAEYRDKQKALQEAAKRAEQEEKALREREALPFIAKPRTYNTMTSVYVPDTREFYRNNGHKHIPSRGV